MKTMILSIALLLLTFSTSYAYNCGIASYYYHGQKTANGERFNLNGFTAAHRTLPFGTMLTVTNSTNGRSVTVRINDRGPFIKGRIIDLSRGAAQAIGLTSSGIGKVCF